MAVLRFSLFGPLRAWRGGAELALGSPQQRAVLAILLLRRGRTVGVGDLVDGVWGGGPPTGAVAVVRTYVSRLRRLLEPERASGQPSGILVSIGDGYALRTGTFSSDLAEFDEAVARAELRRAAGDRQDAVRLLRTVLAAGQGTPLAGVPGPDAEIARADLAERRLGALESALRMELELGRDAAVVPELLALRDAHPLRESMSELLLIALCRGGRQAEALDAYARTRRTLVDELGIEPGPSLRAVHARLLAGDAALAPPTPRAPAPAPDGCGTGPRPAPAAPTRATALRPSPTAAVRPSQLPADLALFTGRRDEIDRADHLLPEGDGPPATAVIGVLDGMPGTGKTTLAVHWAHRIAHRFPDGSLYVNLRGYDQGGSRMDPGEAIGMFLAALGVAPGAVHEGLDARAARYRSALADRRVLILLDNARDTEQVRPLLPGTPGSLVIVTSRSRLSGLVAGHGAHPLTLRPLTAGESLELLARRLGAARVGAEPEAAGAIVDLCARLPLALSIVASRAAHHPGFRLADIGEELRDHHGSLDAFVVGGDAGTDARAVFSWSYNALSAEAATLFRRLALHPAPDISTAAAVALAGAPPRRVRALLTDLTGASLLNEHAPGRFVFHDLLRAYAAELAGTEDTEDIRGAALLRMHDHFLRTAHHACSVLDPFRESITLPEGAPGSEPLRFDDRARATAWLRAERYVLRAIVEHAAAHGYDEHAWRTAWALDVYFNRLGYCHDLLEINGAALRAAEKLGDVVGQAYSLCGLGMAHAQLHHEKPSLHHLERALDLFRDAADTPGLARVHRVLAYLANGTDRRTEALDHYAQARALYRAEGDRNGEAGVLNQVAWTYILIGEHEKALEHGARALRLYEEMGDPYGAAATQDTIGYALHHLGRNAPAIEHFERSARLFHETGDRYLEADVLRHLGAARHATGDRDAARAALRSALALLEEGGHAEADAVRRDLRELNSPAGEGGSRSP
ncbi:BTAD domain-containing putative transcriptional regulator [Streptomyces sp. R08]|uniref:BTAD domain-containing putative transcriptional regulator n=1 Tax=Streptomyces sp. R08 TaxID=3238624 RepID=A0AB39M001_9ACTN